MSRTQSTTSTLTVTRARLIQAQFEIAVARLMNNSAAVIDVIVRPLLRDQRLERFSFYAVDDRNFCQARFELSIDWVRHRHSVKLSGRVEAKTDWLEGGTPEVEKLLNAFQDTVEARGLRVKGRLSLAEGADPAVTLAELGLTPHDPPQWAGRYAELGFEVRRVNELRVDLRVVDEANGS
jgi:hypothetical protein